VSATWIERGSDFVAAAPPTGTAVGLDTEFMRRNTFYPKLALVQIAVDEQRWLLDPLAFDAGPCLRQLVEGGRVCVMHSAGEDMEALAPLLDGVVPRLFDTQIAAAMCGMGAGISYQKLVSALLGRELPKDETRSDWLKRPLEPAQLDYAEQDVAHLEPLRGKLSDELQRRGRSAWHAEDCERLAQRARRDATESPPQAQRAFRAAAEWPRDAQARLHRLLRWRDATARKLDKPRPWLLEDANALSLVQRPPESPAALFERTRGQRALRRMQREELFDVLRAPATPEELAALPSIPGATRGNAKPAVSAMKAAVDATAGALDLPAGLLCPRRLIEEYVVTRQWPDALSGWRRDVLEAKLAPLLPG
jgi:ribonuclease D